MWFTRNAAAAVELPPPLSAEQARALAPLPLWSVDRAVASAAACSLASNDPLHEALLSAVMSAGARGEPLSRVIAAEESAVPPSAWHARMLASAMASAAAGLPPAPAKTLEAPRQHDEVERAVAVSLARLASSDDEAPKAALDTAPVAAVPVSTSLVAPRVANTPQSSIDEPELIGDLYQAPKPRSSIDEPELIYKAPEPRSSIDEPELIYKAPEPRSSADSHAESLCPQLVAMRAAVRSRLKVYEVLVRRAAASAAAASTAIGPTAPRDSAAPYQTLGQQHISDGFDVFG